MRRLAADDAPAARRALATAGFQEKREAVTLDGSLIDARLSYGSGGASSWAPLPGARRLQRGEAEQNRLPFVRDRPGCGPSSGVILSWSAGTGSCSGRSAELGAAPGALPVTEPEPLVVDALSEREREVLERLSGMLSTAEIATEVHLGEHGQDSPQEHLPEAFRESPWRGGPPRPESAPDLILDPRRQITRNGWRVAAAELMELCRGATNTRRRERHG